MLDSIILIAFILAGLGVGYHSVELLPASVLAQASNPEGLRWVTAGFGALIGFAIGLSVQTTYRRLEFRIRKMPADILLSRSVGLVIGLLIANLTLVPIFVLPIPSEFIFVKPLTVVLGSIMFAFTGVNLADTHGRTLLRLINPNTVETLLVAEGTLKPASAKVLDTSSIIDGRIENLLATGFIEGQVIIPQFVLAELQLLADGANDQKRIRGRRGLEILNRIKTSLPERLVIHSADYEDATTVDAKLVRLTQDINGTLITNDYNLNKVARLQEVTVVNINDLAQAVRPHYLPGDSLDLKILKEGKEPSQGVGYLDDGTMVVVEEGDRYVGNETQVVVTSSLQTSAGRMIFARPKTSAIA
jgi:uncharacterized protein YacL